VKMNAIMWARAVVLKLSIRRGGIPAHVTESQLCEYIETGKMNWSPVTLTDDEASLSHNVQEQGRRSDGSIPGE